MAYHEWGEEFDWKALNEACHFFATNLPRYGRISCWTKEKYGTMRFQNFHLLSSYEALHDLIWPEYIYRQWSSRRFKIKIKNEYAKDGIIQMDFWRWFDIYIFTIMARFSGFCWLFRGYQRLVFNIITLIAVKKYKHIQEEITDEHEFQVYLYALVKKYIGYTDQWKSI